MAKKTGKTNKGIRVKNFVADAVIGNYEHYTPVTMFKLNADDVIEIKGDHYTICGQPIRSIDAKRNKIELRGRYAFGKIRRGNKDLFNKHIFNIDMVVYGDDFIYATPIFYFYENDKETGDKTCLEWLQHVYPEDVLKPAKPQIRAVLQWIVDMSNNNKYKNAPVFELHKKASSYIVDRCIEVLEQTGCIDVKDISGVVVCIPTMKGKHALGNKVAN